MSAWCAVNTLPHQERRAEINLRRQGLSVFLPRLWKIRRHARKVDRILEPLFPGYLFVQLDPVVSPWRMINGTYGVRALVMQGDRPAYLPRGFVERLSEEADADGALSAPQVDIKPGDRVQVLHGAFRDCIATVVCLARRERVELLMNMLGGEVLAIAARHHVAPAG